MGSIVDEFVIALGLDPSGVIKGGKQVRDELKRTREAAGGAAGDMETAGKHAANAFAGLRNEVAGLLLALAGANSIKDFVGQMLTSEASAGRMASNLNLSASKLMAWQSAVQTVGGSSGDADQALGQIQQIFMNRQLLGDTSKDNVLAHLGITDPSQLQDVSEGLLKLSEAAARLPKSEFSWSMSQLGINQNMINLLEQGRGGVSALVHEQERQAQVTQDDIQAAQKLQSDLTKLSTIIKGQTRPAITSLVEGMIKVSEDAPHWWGRVDQGSTSFKLLATAVNLIMMPIDQAIGGVRTLVGWFDKLGSTQAWKTVAPLFARVGSDAANILLWLADKAGIGPGTGSAGLFTAALNQANAGGQKRGGASVPVPSGGDRAVRAKAFFMANGYSDDQARGIVAAMWAENPGLDPTTKGPLTQAGHHAYGIGQWLSPDRIQQFRKTIGKSLYGSSFEDQLRFFLWELRNTHKLAGMTAAASGGAVGAGTALINGFYKPGPGTVGDISRMLTQLRQWGAAGQMNVNTVIVQLPGVKNAQEFTRQLPAATRRKALAAQAQSGISG